MSKKVLNLRSSVVENEIPKAPSQDKIEYGEIAINYAAGYETMYVKNSADEIVGIRLDGSVQEATEILALHEARNDNPHGVTKAQVGLANVDNTADIDKPLSNAQTAALALKLDKTAIADNLTTNRSDVALSAAQGIVLLDAANAASGGATADLSALNSRILACEQEVDGTEDDAQELVDYIQAMTANECDVTDITL